MFIPITETIPIETDSEGRMRVRGTRVLLDLVIYAYHQGQTPEHIVQMYPSLTLDSVYLSIGYYLRHSSEINDYLRRIDEQAQQNQHEDEANPRTTPTLDTLRARLNRTG